MSLTQYWTPRRHKGIRVFTGKAPGGRYYVLVRPYAQGPTACYSTTMREHKTEFQRAVRWIKRNRTVSP